MVFYRDWILKFKIMVEEPYFNEQFKNIIKQYIKCECNIDIMRPSALLVVTQSQIKAISFSLIAWRGPDLRFNDDPGLKHLSMGWRLMPAFCWAHPGQLMMFFSSDYPWLFFFIYSKCINLIRLFSVMMHGISLITSMRAWQVFWVQASHSMIAQI